MGESGNRPGCAVQDRVYPISVRDQEYAADDQGNRGQCCVSVVYRL